jgi:hypothetical protein
VDAFWARIPDGPGTADETRRILPDGCLDIVVGPQAAIVVGTMTRPLMLPAGDPGRMIGVRFRPGMATAFLRVPAAALTDDRAPLEAIWSDGSAVADYVGSPDAGGQAVQRLAETLAARLPRTSAVPPDLLAAVERIVASGGRTDVARLAAALGLTRQHLARRFAAHVGIPPKTSAAWSGWGTSFAPPARAGSTGPPSPPTWASATSPISWPNSAPSPASRRAAGRPPAAPVPKLQAGRAPGRYSEGAAPPTRDAPRPFFLPEVRVPAVKFNKLTPCSWSTRSSRASRSGSTGSASPGPPRCPRATGSAS